MIPLLLCRSAILWMVYIRCLKIRSSRGCFAPAPQSQFDGYFLAEDELALTALFEQHHKQLRGVVWNPYCKAPGGMRFYHPDYLKLARKLCDQYQVLLIADEIAAGLVAPENSLPASMLASARILSAWVKL